LSPVLPRETETASECHSRRIPALCETVLKVPPEPRIWLALPERSANRIRWLHTCIPALAVAGLELPPAHRTLAAPPEGNTPYVHTTTGVMDPAVGVAVRSCLRCTDLHCTPREAYNERSVPAYRDFTDRMALIALVSHYLTN